MYEVMKQPPESESPDPKSPQYTSPYWEESKRKSSELGPNPDKYPYTIEATIHSQAIDFNGMRHINNPEDPSLARTERRFTEFVEKSENPIVFVEGGIRNVDGMSREEVITKYGEPGLFTKLAQDNGVEVQSPEPQPDEEVAELLKIFSAEEIVQYYFSRQLFQWYRMKDKDPNIGTAKEYINKGAARWWNQTPGLEDVVGDYDSLVANFAKKYGFKPEEMPDELARQKLHDESSPMNPVSAASSDIRDRYIFEQIQAAAAAGRDIFVVYGSHHAIVFEQILKEINPT